MELNNLHNKPRRHFHDKNQCQCIHTEANETANGTERDLNIFKNICFISCLLRSWSNESKISPSSVQHSCSVKCWICLTTCCTVLGAARCCSALFDDDKKYWERSRTFFCFRCCCALLSEMLDSFDHSIELARFTQAQFHKTPEMYT